MSFVIVIVSVIVIVTNTGLAMMEGAVWRGECGQGLGGM